jgi:prophage antirepressor-like protein
MSRELMQVFSFNEAAIRTIEKDGEPWFVGKDVADVLGYSNSRKAISDHCKAPDTVTISDGTSGNPNMTIIPERDVYRLVMRSKLPAAEQFEEWIVAEVLPAIRKTGQYGTRKPYRRPEIEAAEIFRTFHDTAKRLRMNRNQTALAANAAAQRMTGVDVLELMDIALLPEEDHINSVLLNGLVQLLDAENMTIKESFTQIIERLAAIVDPDGDDSSLPTPHTFRRQMERMRPDLEKRGITFVFGLKHTNKGQIVELTKRLAAGEVTNCGDDFFINPCPECDATGTVEG